MKRNFMRFISILAAVVFVASCIQETYPEGSTIVEEPSIEELLNGLPADMSAAGASGFYASTGMHVDFGLPSIHIMTDCMLEDMAICGNGRYFQYNNYAMNLGMGADGAYASYFWLVYYKGIRSANEIIARIDADTEDPKELSWLGQALAYRAMFYLDLARLYEPKQNAYVEVNSAILGLTVPKVIETTTPEQAADNHRLPREEMYEFILDDLQKAEIYLDKAAEGGYVQSVTKPSIYAVYGLYVRAYIEMGSWDECPVEDVYGKAVSYADKVIAEFAPLNVTQWHDPASGFNKSASNSSWVWGVTLDSSMTNNLFNFTSMMSAEAQFGYAQFTCPGINAWLYKQIPDSDFRKSTWYVSGSGLEYQFAGTLENAEQTKRYAQNYMALKFRPAQGNCVDYSVGVAAEHPLMRVEEMHFLRMEALANTDLSAAVSALEAFMNTYRYTDGTYECKATTYKEFMEEMMIQKRIEFWGEGVMIYDYKRLNMGITRDYKGSVATNFSKDYLLNTTGRSPQWNFCIPLSELQTNRGINSSLNNPDPTSFKGDPQKVL